MQYTEYKKIIDDALVEYVNDGGSTFYIGNARKEYFFEYDNPLLPHDIKKNLSDKAVQCILKNKDLPDGIKLVKVKLHERKV